VQGVLPCQYAIIDKPCNIQPQTAMHQLRVKAIHLQDRTPGVSGWWLLLRAAHILPASSELLNGVQYLSWPVLAQRGPR
jgi:hypothetical protein